MWGVLWGCRCDRWGWVVEGGQCRERKGVVMVLLVPVPEPLGECWDWGVSPLRGPVVPGWTCDLESVGLFSVVTPCQNSGVWRRAPTPILLRVLI